MSAIPLVLQFIENEEDPCADAALAEALPHMEPLAQPVALNILLHRKHLPSLAKTITCFRQAGSSLRSLLLNHFPQLGSAIRVALGSADYEERAGAIEAVATASDTASAYLLVDLLRSPCLRTRELAATALRTMTASLVNQWHDPPNDRTKEKSESQSAELTTALAEGIRTWEVHLQPRILEAAMWLGMAIVPAMRPKLENDRSGFSRIVRRRLETGTDPRAAEFTWCALAIPSLRAAAAQAIASARDPAWIQALSAHTSLLQEPDIQRGFRHVRYCKWLDVPPDALMRLLDGNAEALVRLTASMGTSSERKTQRLREFIDSGHPALLREVMQSLLDRPDESSVQLLALIARRSAPEIAQAAQQELKRLQSAERTSDRVTTKSDAAIPRTSSDWDQSFEQWDGLTSFKRFALLNEWGANSDRIRAQLRSKLRGSNADDRRKSLAIINEWGAVSDFAEDIYRVAHDSDSIVRSFAVALLGHLPGATSERLLRLALQDPDSRVQANAIESLDQLHVAGRADCIRPKLHAHHHRVRANAIRSLLRLELHEAGEALLRMLEDQAGPQRASALWVVERLRLQAVLHRVIHMSHHDPDERVRQRALRVIRELHGTHPHLATVPSRIGVSAQSTHTGSQP
jgi:hypothetical protein